MKPKEGRDSWVGVRGCLLRLESMAGQIMCNIGSIPISRMLFFSFLLFCSFSFHLSILFSRHWKNSNTARSPECFGSDSPRHKSAFEWGINDSLTLRIIRHGFFELWIASQSRLRSLLKAEIKIPIFYWRCLFGSDALDSLNLKWKSSFYSSALLALSSIYFLVLQFSSSFETFLPDVKRSRLKVNFDRKSFIFRCFSTGHFTLLQPHGQDAIDQFFNRKETIAVVDQWLPHSLFQQHRNPDSATMEVRLNSTDSNIREIGDTEIIWCVF
jgi:hypothetical protein